VLLEILREKMSGSVFTENETFFLRAAGEGNIEFTLVAEGWRKLGLLWVLIQNGTLASGSILFWDEPEANLNPSMYQHVVRVLLALERMGVQIFISTHDYVFLKELELHATRDNNVLFHSLYRTPNEGVKLSSTDDYYSISPNAISDTFARLYDTDLQRALSTRQENATD
jgi:wobble nucleotide-excising tRNase